ncbi:MAG TPA: oxygen-dependent coproporphyrinogen oxidase [Bacteroidia bacterium]|nr:oxygen-dependent coproporphyrinogen oxidase [Bacteroidia bacterium]
MQRPEFSSMCAQSSDWFMNLQNQICTALENADGKGKFKEDCWTREEGGGGKTRVIQNGNILEKGGVNFSEVWGKLPAFMTGRESVSETDLFYATGISIVLHPKSPMQPIIHMNTRYFETSSGKHWFGGGIDLTPHYINHDNARFFHTELKKVCDQFSTVYYPKFKNWADDYFFIPHRNETRGIGGIFFDNLSETAEYSKQERFNFVQAVGSAFAPIYIAILEKNKSLAYGSREEQWQRLRRGRYVEFNLVYDKGTRFGLETNGRIESILMSLPPHANWEYAHVPEVGSAEQVTQSLLVKGIDWAN